MTNKIPDDVIEAMADAYTQGRGVTDEQLNSVTAVDHRMRAALAAAEAKGWKLVPVELTSAMGIAFVRRLSERGKSAAVMSLFPEDLKAAYSSMISAAPLAKP